MARIFFEDFETDGNGTRYTTSVPEFTDSFGDFFTRTDGTDIGSFVELTGQEGNVWFGAMDINGEGADSQQSILFSGIDIAGFENLSFSGLFAEDDDGANQDWDEVDFVHIEARIDGGAFQTILALESDEANGEFNGEPRVDTDFDGIGDGTALSPTFATLMAPISGTGDTLDLRITLDLDSGDEDIAFDALEITGDDGMDGVVTPPPSGDAAFTLELLHIADQEPLNAGGSLSDITNLSGVLNALRDEDLGMDGEPDNTLTLSSGDAIIPGLFFSASEDEFGAAGIADILIQNELGIEAIALGNHEFDFGTQTLAELISGVDSDSNSIGTDQNGDPFGGADFPYLSTNLDFSTDASLAPLEVDGGNAPEANSVTSSVVIDVNGESIGVVGATTPTLGSISSPGDLGIAPAGFDASDEASLDALAAEIQAEVDALLAANDGLNKVVLLAHMQQIEIEQALATRLSNVDIIVAGGSNTRLFDENDRVRDGDTAQGDYPGFFTGADGNPVAVVNTDGSYKYVGRLVVDFDENGVILPESYDPAVSGAYATDDQGVMELNAEGLIDPEIQQIVDAVEAQIIATEGNVLGFSDVFLNGNRSGGDTDGVRTQETNLGNLTADANLAYAKDVDADVVISLKNGGGIRASIGETVVPAGGTEAVRTPNQEVQDSDGNVVKPEGGISQDDIETTLAFNNDLVILTLTAQEIVDLLEHGVGALPGVSGRFPQVSGVEFAFNEALPSGSRITEARIVDENGAEIASLVEGGSVVNADTEYKIVTLGFLAAPRFNDEGEFTGGGDGYPFPNTDDAEIAARVSPTGLEQEGVQTGDATFADDGTEQDALAEYLLENFGTPETAFDEEDEVAAGDARIVQVAEQRGIVVTQIGIAELANEDNRGSEVVAYSPDDQTIAVTNGKIGTIDLFDISDPTTPVLLQNENSPEAGSIDVEGAIDAFVGPDNYNGIQSVATNGDITAVAVALGDDVGDNGGFIHFGGVVGLIDNTTGEFEFANVGFLPDMLAFTPDGNTLLVADEGEADKDSFIGDVILDNPGSVSIIDVSDFANFDEFEDVEIVGFEGFDEDVEALMGSGVRLFPDALPSEDLEPEYIAVSEDGSTAFVTLQEANAVAVLDIESATFTEILGLGTVDHSQEGNELDPSDRGTDGDVINRVTAPVQGLRMPDAIATFDSDGVTYFVTANEGDARDKDKRINDDDLTLDPTAFPDAATLKQDENLGRLQVSSIDGDTDGDGDFDELFSYGSRSFTIFDADGNVVFDSGGDFERIIEEQLPPNAFNNEDFPEDDASVVNDGRSDNKGPEPEAVTVGEVNGSTYAFIGLERVSGVFVYDISDPANSEFVQFIPTAESGLVSIETLEFVSAEDSPNGKPLLLAAAEDSGNTGIFEINIPVRISEIQGAGHTSPLNGQVVTTTGVVTAVDSNGFYIQDPEGDGNDATSEALFVFTGGAPGVEVGQSLAVTGGVSEFFPGGESTGNLSTTQIAFPSSVQRIADLGPVTPTVIGADGRVVPTENIDDDAFGSFDAETDGIDFFESLEGMLVTAQDLHVVAGTNRFGEIFAVTDNGDGATGLSERGTLNISPDDFNPEKIQIDEDSGIFNFDFPDVNVGDSLGDVTGVVGYGFGNFEILVTEDFTDQIVSGDLAPESTDLTGSLSDLTVATYNVLNLDPNDEDGDTDVANGRFDAIAAQIVSNLNGPDIVGLQEIQDNTGSVDDGVTSASDTLQQLVDAIAAAGGPTYAFADNTFIGNNTSGGQPGANIRTAFLYNADRVDLVEGSLQTIDGQAEGEAFEGARLPLMGTFTFNGEEVTIINNHFSSKGGSAPILGREQPFETRQEEVEVNGSLDERQRQSQAVEDVVTGLLAEDENANVIVLGDLNEFEFVSPVSALETEAGLTNLTNSLAEDERYSFIFQGNSQALDHILVSDSLAGDAQVDFVHVNSEFAETSERASDHDPIVASFDLNDAPIGLELIGSLMLSEGTPVGFEIGTIAGIDPDEGDVLTVSMTDDAGGLLAFDGTRLTLAQAIGFDAAITEFTGTFLVTDQAGETFTDSLTFEVDVASQPVTAGNEGGPLDGSDDADRIEDGTGNDAVMPGLGIDLVSLLNGGTDSIVGEAGDFNNDVVVGFGNDDSFVFEGARLNAGDISFNDETNELVINGETVLLADNDLSGGNFLVTTTIVDGQPVSTVQYHAVAAETTEGVALDVAEVNGIVPPEFLTGANASAFAVTLENGGAGFANTLGFFTIDMETDAIGDVGILFEDAREAGAGAMASITGLEESEDLGFFLVQNGASLVAGLTGTIGLVEQDGQLFLSEDGAALEDTIIFNSHDSGLNVDGLQHAHSGANADGSMFVGFEDLIGGGDRDYQDVVFNVAVVSDDPLA